MQPPPTSYEPQPTFAPPKPQNRSRKIKLIIYSLLLIVGVWFIYQRFAAPKDQTLSSGQTANTQPVSDTETKAAEQFQPWVKPEISLPIYSPLNSSSDLKAEMESIEIPDFKGDFDTLRSNIDTL